VFARQAFALCLPNEKTFLKLDRKQIGLNFGFTLLPLFVRQCALVIGFGVTRADSRLAEENAS
jgi:hypothetical protein